MHFSIPDTEEFSDENGSAYMVRSVTFKQSPWKQVSAVVEMNDIFVVYVINCHS